MATLSEINLVNSDSLAHPIGEIARRFGKLLEECDPVRPPVAFVGDHALDSLGAAAWLAQTGTDGLVVPRERLSTDVRAELLSAGFQIVELTERTSAVAQTRPSPVNGRISLLTSGTTGKPRLIRHTWKSLFTTSRIRNPKPLNWLLTYQAGTYAWYQIVTMALFVPSQSVTLCSIRDPLEMMETALRHGVTAISATPTFWRMVLLQFSAETLRGLELQQITLGGERVDQEILDHLPGLFPSASITHIYASSEAGACIVVRDGREGFPSHWLDREQPSEGFDETPRLQIRDGILWVQSPHAAIGQSDWINTGDAVEVREDRVVILGRVDQSIINVGGQKIASCDVERFILQHPSITWCRVYGRRAPLVGALVAADVVFQSGKPAVSERELVEFCSGKMAEIMVPRVWRFLDRIPVTSNLKTEMA